LAVIQAILGFFLILFIPGYAITLVLYPRPNELSSLRRITLSVVFSMGSVMLIVLFIDEVLAVNTTPPNIAGAILIFSLFAVAAWKAELILNEKISKYIQGDGDGNRNSRPGRRFRLRPRSESDEKDVWEKRIWNGRKK